MSMDIYDAIRVLEEYNTYALSDRFRNAIYIAVGELKKTCEKPSLDDRVFSIRYFNDGIKKWGYRYHEGRGDSIEMMPIRELVELAKSGALEKDKFTSVYSDKLRKLEGEYVRQIKRMLVKNGYVTEEEVRL